MAAIKKLSSEELFAFSDEMSMMIASGISAVEGITLMLEEAERKEEQDLLKTMQDTLYATNSLTTAIKETKVFPEYFEYMIEVGEQTGKTDEVLASLSRYYERETAIYRAIRSAVSYPLLMVAMMLIIIVVLVTQIMPIFERVFTQLGSSMTGISGGILKFGNFLGTYSVVFLVIVAVLVALGIYVAKNSKCRKKVVAVCAKWKTFRRIYDKIAVSRFASGMAMTLSSGMDTMQAIEVSGRLVNSATFVKKIEKCKSEFKDTMDIGAAFSVAGIFTGLYGRMAVLAAKTGNLEQVMEKIANTYQDEADDEIHNLISIVEPTLVIVLSIVVGMILMSVMLPLLSIMTGMH